MLSTLYARVAEQRRRWYAHRPEARRRLAHPVISVGALAAGGSGKTPVVADVAELLLGMGERPAILSRGYRRQHRLDGVIVVRDPEVLRSDVATAGDEPFMLARRLAGTSVLVAEDRYLAGRLAERQFGTTVHVLDDGFQHLALDRDVDLVVLGAQDLDDARTLPTGRLRERPETAHLADALIVETPFAAESRQIAGQFSVRDAFHFTKRSGDPRDAETDQVAEVASGARVLVVVGIARPEPFVESVKTRGYEVAEILRFEDHHRFTRRDLATIKERAASLGIDHIVTTEKDLVRLRPFCPLGLPVAWLPLVVTVEPVAPFRVWLSGRLAQARTARRVQQF